MAKRQDKEFFEIFQEANIEQRDFLRDLIGEVLRQVMEAEIESQLGAGHYERTDSRLGYRNGYKPRTLNTRVGTLELEVPQDRDGLYRTEVFERYHRSEKALWLTVHEMIVSGVSTRKVDKIAKELGVYSLSRSTASRMASSLDEEVGKWLTRPLNKTYPYLVVDARYEKVREAGRVVSKGVLIAVGIDDDGYREILGVYVADSESETSWGEMFEDLKMRGLSGVQLIVSDQHSGLMNAIRRYFDGAVWQRCAVHYVRNFKNKLNPKQVSKFLAMLKKVWEEESVEDARRKASELISALERVRPDVAEWIEETIDDTFAIYAFPARHRRKLKSTNMLERVNQELKRRTLVVRIFPNVRACLRMCATLCMEYSEEWSTGKRYLTMENPTKTEIETEPNINLQKI